MPSKLVSPAVTQPSISALLQQSPETFLQMEDAIRPKYTWGEWAHPLEILSQLRAHLTKSIGLGWPELEPNTLLFFVKREFGDISEVTAEKILALQNILVTDIPWNDFDIFENACLAFTNQIPIFGEIEPLDVHEMAFGAGILDAIRQEEYSSDVLGYMAAVMQYNGMITVPDNCPIGDAATLQSIMWRTLPSEVRELAKMAQREWAADMRIVDEGVDLNALENQIYNFQVIEDWYNAGNKYVPQIAKLRKERGRIR